MKRWIYSLSSLQQHLQSSFLPGAGLGLKLRSRWGKRGLPQGLESPPSHPENCIKKGQGNWRMQAQGTWQMLGPRSSGICEQGHWVEMNSRVSEQDERPAKSINQNVPIHSHILPNSPLFKELNVITPKVYYLV